MRDTTWDLEVQGAKVECRPEDQCHQDKAATHIGTKRGDGVSVIGGGSRKWTTSNSLGALLAREALTRTFRHELERRDWHFRS